jgi:HSP20 family protein
VITAELPEVKHPDVKVTVENGILTLRGERKIEKEQKETRYHLVERSYGTFERRFSLPGDADPKMVNAAFKDGVLRISIGRSEAARPRQIEVHAG